MRILTHWTAIVVAACSLILQLQGVLGNNFFLQSMCGTAYPSGMNTRIMHGRNAIMGSAPFMALLVKDGAVWCGGTIINQRYILTAAHCIDDNLTVRLGEYDISKNPDCVLSTCLPSYDEYHLSLAIPHKNYRNYTFTNDIALLKLQRDIVFKPHIIPICLLLNPTKAPRRQQYQAFGWGKTHNEKSSNVLQTTTLDLYRNYRCSERLNAELTNNQICLGHPESDTCQGDSGGPVVTQVNYDGVVRYLQIGLVSFGDSYCRSPGVYTYVPRYISWMRSVMQRAGF